MVESAKDLDVCSGRCVSALCESQLLRCACHITDHCSVSASNAKLKQIGRDLHLLCTFTLRKQAKRAMQPLMGGVQTQSVLGGLWRYWTQRQSACRTVVVDLSTTMPASANQSRAATLCVKSVGEVAYVPQSNKAFLTNSWRRGLSQKY